MVKIMTGSEFLFCHTFLLVDPVPLCKVDDFRYNCFAGMVLLFIS